MRSNERGSQMLLERMAPWGTKATWAVWDDDDLTFPRRPSGLHTRVVALTFNEPHAWDEPDSELWLNLHSSRRGNDHFLARALRGTPAWGGYLTTLHARPDEALLAELAALEASDPLVLLIGGKARDLFLAGADDAAPALGSTAESLQWVDLPHVSPLASRLHRADPDHYASLVHWSLRHPRTARPWTLPGSPGR